MKILSILVVAVAVLTACQETKVSDQDIPIVHEDQIDEAAGDEKTVIVDVRKPEAYATGHIPGAVNIYLPEIRANDSRLAGAKRIIVYSAGVRDPLGVAAAKRLVAVGYVNVQEYKGGAEQWKAAGRELVGSLPAAEVRPDTESQP